MSVRNLRRGALRSSALAGALGASLVAFSAQAQEATYAFDIPPESLSKALRDYGRAADRQLIFTEDLVRGLRAQGLRGRYAPSAAMDRLLAGTDLTWRTASSGGLMIVRKEPPSPQAGAAASNADEIPRLSEVVVTGSRLSPSKSDTTPVNTYSEAAIARSGQTNLTGFLNTLPEVSVGSSGDAFGLAGQNTVRLRGMPAGSTLVLLNGRRVAASAIAGGSAIFDLNAIPSDLIDRVDIVPMGSSAVYGSDAIGGVVNLVLKTRVSGIGGSVSESLASDYSDFRATFALGRTFSRGAISLIASYREQGDLRLGDRDFSATGDFRRFAALGGADRRTQFCDPGTVFAASGNLNGLGATSAGIPATGAAPKFAISDFTAAAGRPNLCHLYAGYNIVPSVKGPSGVLSGEFSLTQDVTLYGDLFYSRYVTDNTSSGNPVSRVSVPAANAFNPFGQTVQVSTLFPGLSGYRETSEVVRPLIGARGGVGSSWSWDAAIWRNITRDRLTQVLQNGPALTAALASASPATALDPFRPTANSPALLQSIFTRPTNTYRTEQTGADAVLRGPLLVLPAGPLSAALGWEGGHETVGRTTIVAAGPVDTHGKRDTQSVFAEARIPILPGADADIPLLQADLAARYDHYSDFGSSTTPQAAVEFRPLSRLTFRAAYSEAFKAPTLLQLFAGQTFTTPLLNDPKLGVPVTVTAKGGGNPNLRPETAKADSFTVGWKDPDRLNLRLSLTYFTIREQSRIVPVNSQTVLNNEDVFVGRVTRGVPAPGATVGPVTAVDATFLNFAGLKLSGADVSLAFDLPLGGGVLSPSLAVTRTFKFTSQIAPGTPYVDRLSRATMTDVWAPKYKATVGAAWTRGGLALTGQGRYVGRYLDFQTPVNTNHLGDYWTFDASAEVALADLPGVASRMPAGFYARLSVTNLFDRTPRYSNYNSGILGFDPTLDDFIGRRATLTLGRRF